MLGEKITEATKGGRKTYLNLTNGAVVKRTPEGEERYSYVAGRVISISQRERDFRGEKVLYWYIDLKDVTSGEVYSLGFPYSSNTFKSVILQLSSRKGLASVASGGTIKIEPYPSGKYTNVQLYTDDGKLEWAVKELPAVEVKDAGGIKVKDDTKRMALIEALTKSVKANINPSAN